MNNNILKSAVIVFAMTMLYRIFGFVRELLIAYSLGASAQADAYYLAFTTPNLIVNLIAFGAISSAAVPLFVKHIDNKDMLAVNKLFNKTASILFVILVFLTIILVFNADIVVHILAPGFDGQTYALAVSLLQKMLPAIIFIGLLGLIISVLQSFQDFFTAAFSHTVFNIVLVISGVMFIWYKDMDILAYAVFVAAVLQFLLVFVRLRGKGVFLKFDFDLEDKDIGLLFRLMLPIFFTTIVMQINLALGRGFASTLEQGSLAALNYADKLINLPMGVLVSAVTVVTYPVIASYANSNDKKMLADTLQKSLKTLFFITVPVVIVFNFLGIPIVNILFERGQFSSYNTIATASALAYYSYGIIGAAFTDLLNKVFYSYQDTLTPLKISVISMLINILLIFILLPKMSLNAIALAFSISSILNAIILFLVMIKKYIVIRLNITKRGIFKTIVLLIIFTCINMVILYFFDKSFMQEDFLLKIVYFSIMLAGLFLTYILSLNVFNIFNIKEIIVKSLLKKEKI